MANLNQQVEDDLKSIKLALENASLASVKFIESKYTDVVKAALRKHQCLYATDYNYNLRTYQL